MHIEQRSGKLLREMLGFAEDSLVWSPHPPEKYFELIRPVRRAEYSKDTGQWHLFFTKTEDVKVFAEQFAMNLPKDGSLWVSWPKQATTKTLGVVSEISAQDFRTVLLKAGLVDVKVCSIDDVWSGLKFVWRKT